VGGGGFVVGGGVFCGVFFWGGGGLGTGPDVNGGTRFCTRDYVKRAGEGGGRERETSKPPVLTFQGTIGVASGKNVKLRAENSVNRQKVGATCP